MIAEILATGDEVCSGAVVDSNSAFLAREMEAAGILVTRHTSVRDDLAALEKVITEIGQRADLALVTGGLGPTDDDLTVQAAAAAAGMDLRLDAQALAAIQEFFQGRGLAMSESNRKQAFLPQEAQRLDNPIGTAPGFALKIGRCWFFFMPGVPWEMQRMFAEQVLPRLDALTGADRLVRRVRIIGTFGLPESQVNDRLRDLLQGLDGIRLGLRAKFPEIQVRLYAEARDAAAAEELLETATSRVRERLGHKVFSLAGESLETVVGGLLLRNGASLAVAESCTGGLLSDLLTNVPGSSGYFRFSAVTYANAAKTGILGVFQDTLADHGAVHETTAREMAANVRRLAGTDYALATTGIAGPEGGTPEKPVGTVCIALATPEKVSARRFGFPLRERLQNKRLFATIALELLRRELLEIATDDSGQ